MTQKKSYDKIEINLKLGRKSLTQLKQVFQGNKMIWKIMIDFRLTTP